jgi:type II secretory pathway pseudopilin PulG
MRLRRERGITLMVSMLIVIALLGAGIAAVWLSSMGNRVAGNLNARQAAMNAANAGIQHARQVIANYWNGLVPCVSDTLHPLSCALAGQANAKDRLPTSTTPLPQPNGNGVGAILYDGTVALTHTTANLGFQYPPNNCAADSDCTLLPGTRCISNVCDGPLGSYTVWIRNDNIDVSRAMNSGNANLELLKDSNDTVIVRAEGRDFGNNAVVVVEAAVAKLNNNTSSVAPSLTFGKNINQYGNNTMTGSVKF